MSNFTDSYGQVDVQFTALTGCRYICLQMVVGTGISKSDLAGEYKIKGLSIQKTADAEAATVITDKKGITADNFAAAAGDTVTLSLTPPTGWQLSANSLTVTGAASGNKIRVTRKNYQQGGSDTQYTFEMPDEKVNVTLQYYNPATSAAPNITALGHSYNQKLDGLRSGFRFYVTCDEGGTYYTTIGGAKKEVTAFGVLTCTQKTYSALGDGGLKVETVGTTPGVVNRDFTQSDKRLDVCDTYQDVTVVITGMNDEQKQVELYTIGYLTTADGTTYYTALTHNSYNSVRNTLAG